ncbi:MAG: hypothetical protein RLZZ04_3983 [Cyanobacteriota bacterium]|jgi:medium-chain acyl-[acyl-carrier-protein] hydrolase
MTNTQTFNSWIAYSKPSFDAKLRLFCFPYAGGGASIFRSWSRSLTSDVEICPIELPGRGSRLIEHPFTQLEPLVEKLSHALLPYLDKPFAFFGHSMGGLISFETAHLLQKNFNLSPVYLFMSGCPAPKNLFTQFSKLSIHHLPESEFISALRNLNGIPKAALENAQFRKLFLPILRADFALMETHVHTPKPRFNCPITVLGGLQDYAISSYDNLEAWREQTNAAFSIQMFEGDHFFVRSARSLLLQFLDQELRTIANRMN